MTGLAHVAAVAVALASPTPAPTPTPEQFVPLTRQALTRTVAHEYGTALQQRGFRLTRVVCAVNDDEASGLCIGQVAWRQRGVEYRESVAVTGYKLLGQSVYWQARGVTCWAAVSRRVVAC